MTKNVSSLVCWLVFMYSLLPVFFAYRQFLKLWPYLSRRGFKYSGAFSGFVDLRAHSVVFFFMLGLCYVGC